MNSENTQSDEKANATTPNGFFVTLREIYDTVKNIDKKLDEEISKLKEEISKIKAQMAAQWVVIGIQITVIASLALKGLSL